jgi:hypothetical protein
MMFKLCLLFLLIGDALWGCPGRTLAGLAREGAPARGAEG